MLNKKLADFTLPSTGDKVFRLKDHAGSKLVIYFYPKDSTPGCTTQGQNFRDAHAAFRAAGCGIVGISRDSTWSHKAFKKERGIKYDLLADPMLEVTKKFGLEHPKVPFISHRATVVVDKTGKVAYVQVQEKTPEARDFTQLQDALKKLK